MASLEPRQASQHRRLSFIESNLFPNLEPFLSTQSPAFKNAVQLSMGVAIFVSLLVEAANEKRQLSFQRHTSTRASQEETGPYSCSKFCTASKSSVMVDDSEIMLIAYRPLETFQSTTRDQEKQNNNVAQRRSSI